MSNVRNIEQFNKILRVTVGGGNSIDRFILCENHNTLNKENLLEFSFDLWYNIFRQRRLQYHKKGEIKMLNIGDRAPEFTLKDKNGNDVRLSDFIGKKIVLYFYPKDNTPGCTRQACAFAGAYAEFQKRGVEVIGISRDGIASHVKFAEKYNLPFVLLSDPDLEAIQSYGVWQEKKLYGKVSFGVVRTTFIIDENGIIEKVMPKVKPDTNAQEILEFL